MLAIVSTILTTSPPSIDSRPATVTLHLRDNRAVRVRPLMRTDREQLVEGFRHLSEASRYQRFLSPTAQLSGSQLTYLTNIDHIDHFAWGVESTDGTGIAIARYVRTGPDTAEAAFTINDAFHGCGLGWRMLQALAMVAAGHGISRFEMTMLADNASMAHLAGKAGAVFEQPDGGTIRAEVDLLPAIWSDLPRAEELLRLASAAARAE